MENHLFGRMSPFDGITEGYEDEVSAVSQSNFV